MTPDNNLTSAIAKWLATTAAALDADRAALLSTAFLMPRQRGHGRHQAAPGRRHPAGRHRWRAHRAASRAYRRTPAAATDLPVAPNLIARAVSPPVARPGKSGLKSGFANRELHSPQAQPPGKPAGALFDPPYGRLGVHPEQELPDVQAAAPNTFC